MKAKSDLVNDVMREIDAVYKDGSGVYQSVERGLSRLSAVQLAQLHSMIWTSRKHPSWYLSPSDDQPEPRS